MTNAIPIQATGLEAVIGRKIKNLMLDHGNLKATHLAKITGLEATGLSRRLSGKRGWEPDDLAVISFVFDVSVAYLFGEIDRIAPLPAHKVRDLAQRFPWAHQLPHLDSNQEPIGSQPGPLGELVDIRHARRLKGTREADHLLAEPAIVTPIAGRR